jgi:hypothetical protein
MKKITVLLMTLTILVFTSNAQIPNNGFENWKTVANCIEPAGWYSFYSLFDSSGTYCPVTRSTDHYPESIGSYSVCITNDTTLWKYASEPSRFLGWGMLGTAQLNDQPLFPLTGHNTSLCGYYKFLPQNNDTMNINVYLYKNGVEVANGHLLSNAAVASWTPFNIVISSYTDADSARITLSAAMEPKGGGGIHGNSVLYVDNLSFDVLITSEPEQAADKIPGTFTLSQNYPNPFNPNTTIEFALPKTEFAMLQVFNVLGRQVSSLVADKLNPGVHKYEWHADNLPSGIYYYRLHAGEFEQVRKMILLK